MYKWDIFESKMLHVVRVAVILVAVASCVCCSAPPNLVRVVHAVDMQVDMFTTV